MARDELDLGAISAITTFGELLKHLRRRAQLTQQELGTAVGYSFSHVARLERDERLPDVAAVRTRFIEALDLRGRSELAQRLVDLAERAHRTPQVEVAMRAAPRTTHPTNLPAQLTRFIGREREVAVVQRLVTTNRIVTLTGSSGVGKTRLAVEVGATLVGATRAAFPFPDGVWLAELAPLNDPALVTPALAQVFALAETPGIPPLNALIAHLGDKRLLLVLDNCEHLVQAGAQLAEALLVACPHLYLLATSREPLRISGETTWRVPSLSTPDAMPLPDVAEVGAYEAVQLFVEHAASVQPGFTLTAENVAAVAQICRRLDGIPLAIEMAAARVHAMSAGEIAARLDWRFDLLSSGRRTALPRHQTLRATLDWSYGLLTRPEQVLLARLSVFAGGCTADLAEAVAAATGEGHGTREGGTLPALRTTDILPLLLQLVEKSMVVAEPRGGATRYRLLESVRQYSAEKLGELGEVDRVYERLADYVVSMAAPSADPRRRGRNEESVVRTGRLEAELDNLRALVAWSRTRPDGTRSLQLAATLADLWGSAQGHDAEVQAWLEEALERGHAAPPTLRMKALNGLLRTLADRGYNLARWAPLAEESLALSARAGDPYERYESLNYAYNVHEGLWRKLALWTRPAQWEAHLPQMEELAEEMLALGRRLEYPHGIAVALMFTGDVRILRGDPAAALSHYESGLRLAQETGNDGMALAIIKAMEPAAPTRALEACEQEVARQRELDGREGLAWALRQLCLLTAGTGDFTRAQGAALEGLSLRHKLGLTQGLDGGIGSLHYDLGRVTWLQGDYPRALDHLQQAFDIAQSAGLAFMLAQIHLFVGLTHLALGDVRHAAGPLLQTLGQYRELDAVFTIPYALAALGLLAQAQGHAVRAGRLAGAAMMLGDQSQKWPWWAGINRRLYVRLAAAVSSLRDNPATAASWAEGQQMMPDTAVAYALQDGEADEPQPPVR